MYTHIHTHYTGQTYIPLHEIFCCAKCGFKISLLILNRKSKNKRAIRLSSKLFCIFL